MSDEATGGPDGGASAGDGGVPAGPPGVTDVAVERDGEGGLVVTWTPLGGCDRVDLAAGRSADGLDHRRMASIDAGAGRAVLDVTDVVGRGSGAGRVYVSVAPVTATGGGVAAAGAVVAAERRVGFAGPVNFRDLGGYRTASGRTVRWGRAFRSDALLLTHSDIDAFTDLGIRTVYDLRSELERTANPNRLPAGHGASIEVVPLVSEDPESSPLAAIGVGDGENFLERLYGHVLDRSAEKFALILGGLADEDRLPAVFHCSAGKDRTGMLAALILSVLGVPRRVVLDDYELTAQYRTAAHVEASMRRMREQGNLPPEMVAGILRTPRRAMQAAIEALEERYRGIDGYLRAAGADAGLGDRLRRALLSP